MPTNDEVDTSRTAEAAALREKQARKLRKEQRREFRRGLRLRLWCRLSKRQPGPAVAPGWPSRSGKTLPITTLSPEFRPGEHQLYVDLLERALRHPDVHSIALTGAYGSGKSSVLRALKRHWWKRCRIVELTLSTLDPSAVPTADSGNPAESAASNRIQKELVKQLLYRLPTWRTPHSRFQRATRLGTWPAVLTLAMGPAGGAMVWLVAHIIGWDVTINARFSSLDWDPRWAWPSLSVLLGLIILLVRRALSGRYSLHAGVEAGALSVKLEPTSSSYFDQYLDEIMYFFQASRVSIVLIEDVDRFDDALVFDTFRALNTLVNGSGQVRRRIVFVYAIRDSVLAKIGTETGRGSSPAAGVQPVAGGIDRANRTKYFDVVIPMVPFVTTDSARDLMMRVMAPHVQDDSAQSSGVVGISPALVRLAARHVADMRTILSIRNEFEVHLDRLMASAENRVPEISKDAIFALVLIRATCPEAFEEIRLKSSPLDALVVHWVRLVDENIRAQVAVLTQLRSQLENGSALERRSDTAGRRLDALRPELTALVANYSAGAVTFGGPLTDANLADAAGWQQIAEGIPLLVELRQAPGRAVQTTISLSRQILGSLIGMSLEPGEWDLADLDDLRRKIETTERELLFLRHHTWEELYGRTDLKLSFSDTDWAALKAAVPANRPEVSSAKAHKLSFAGLVNAYAPSPLVVELVASGFLTRHFARYSAVFYSDVVGLNAAEYIARAIEPGVPIAEFELDDKAVSQILEEQGVTSDDADLFDDLSIYNLDLVDYLMRRRRGAAARVAEHLAERWGELERQFVERFFQRKEGAGPGLASLMAPTWPQAIRFTVVDAEVTPEMRLRLVDAVLRSSAGDQWVEPDSDVADYLSAHYEELSVVVAPESAALARAAMSVVARSGATIRDLRALNQFAIQAAGQLNVYPVTTANLRALRGDDGISMDVLRSKPEDRPIYDYMLADLAVYLKALAGAQPPIPAVSVGGDLAAVLNDVVEVAPFSLCDDVIRATGPECRVADLSDVDLSSWTSLVRHRRTAASFGNVQLYLAEFGVDETLGDFLGERGEIEMPESLPPLSERNALAVKLLAARDRVASGDRRVSLAASVDPGEIAISDLEAEDASLIGPLLAKALLADEAETFDPGRLKRWEDLEAAISASKEFGEFADGGVMPPKYLASALRSTAVHSETKAALVAKLSDLIGEASERDATAIAMALADRRDSIGIGPIDELRSLGASTTSIVQLLASQGNDVSRAELRAILRKLRGDYARLADGGRGVVHFANSRANELILQRLQWVTHTGAYIDSTLMNRGKLAAHLKQPPPGL